MTNAEVPRQHATLALDQALQQAIAHHQTGQLHEAEQGYRTILQSHPEQPDTNHNLGMLLAHMEKCEAGLPYLVRDMSDTANPFVLAWVKV